MNRLFSGSLNYFTLILLSTLLFNQVVYATEKLVIYTVNYPLQYFAQRIGGEYVTVNFPAPNDVDPAFWEPDTKTITEYQSADLILLNGVNYAKWVNKVSLPRRRLVDTSRGFTPSLIKTEAGLVHNHGPAGEHSHAGMAFTTWLDFSLAMAQAEAITRALIKKRPAQQADFEKNKTRLMQDLQRLDQAMLEAGERLAMRPLLASHPVYQYLARRYNLNIKSVTWEPDHFPSDEQWGLLEQLKQGFDARLMLWESKPLANTLKKLLIYDIKPVIFAPCMNRPEMGDFLTVMQANIRHLQQAFESER